MRHLNGRFSQDAREKKLAVCTEQTARKTIQGKNAPREGAALSSGFQMRLFISTMMMETVGETK